MLAAQKGHLYEAVDISLALYRCPFCAVFNMAVDTVFDIVKVRYDRLC